MARDDDGGGPAPSSSRVLSGMTVMLRRGRPICRRVASGQAANSSARSPISRRIAATATCTAADRSDSGLATAQMGS